MKEKNYNKYKRMISFLNMKVKEGYQMAGMYVKYKCKHCGRVEYWPVRGARSFPNPFLKGCKKTKHGYHEWDELGRVDAPPKGYKHVH